MKKKMVLLIPVTLFIGIFVLFRTVFFVGFVPSASMEPTIRTDSLIFGTRIYEDLSEGDIIVFEHEDSLLVKRIIGVGGQIIEVEGISYTIPSNCYFVVGDNKENSWDSRFWEEPFVRKSSVVAKL